MSSDKSLTFLTIEGGGQRRVLSPTKKNALKVKYWVILDLLRSCFFQQKKWKKFHYYRGGGQAWYDKCQSLFYASLIFYGNEEFRDIKKYSGCSLFDKARIGDGEFSKNLGLKGTFIRSKVRGNWKRNV